jgi:AraC family transcriptional regulator
MGKYGLIQPRFVERKAWRAAGIRSFYSYANRNGIPAQWSRFGEYMGKIPGQIGAVSYGMVFTESGGFDYMTAVEVSDCDGVPAELQCLTIPGFRFAVFPHEGEVASLPRTIDAIYKDWLPESGHSLAPGYGFFERYGETFDPATLKGEMELWVPLKGDAV